MKEKINFGNMTAYPGEKLQGYSSLGDTGIEFPMTLINGKREGKTVILSSGLHGGEYPSIEAAIQLAGELTPEDIKGQLVIFHPVNVAGFLDRVSYIYPGSGENLNRFYPGKPDGTVGERAAYIFTGEYQNKADFFIDIHGGDLHEYLPPYVYYPGIGDEEVIEKSRRAACVLNVSYMVKSSAVTGAYNSSAINGTPGLLIERGSRGLWTKEEVEAYKFDIKNLLRHLEMLDGKVIIPEKPAKLIKRAEYLEARHSGCWYPAVMLEEEVKKGRLLGVIKDFFGNILEEIHADFDGIVLFMTVSLAVREGDPIITYGV